MAGIDIWRWNLVLDDESEYPEYETEIDQQTGETRLCGQARSITDVDKSRIRAIGLIPNVEGYPAHGARVAAGSSLDFFRRRAQESSLDTGEVVDERVLHFIEVKHEAGASVCIFFHPDGSVFVSDDRDAMNP